NTLESEGSHHAREQGRRVQNLQAEMRNTQNPVQESHPEYLDAQIFYHQFQVKLGERGRINLPSQWVNKFQNIGGYENQFLVTPITDHENPHIQVYIANPPECNHILKPVRGVNTGSQKYITSIDTSGRIGISTGLRQELGWEAPLPVTLEGHANYFTIHKK
ncbi:MAG: hypothetical protein QF632_06110, partial [Candidatus Woesearchaeota archaeon]|nr:hypothetical protein [Candidatus Woesearchaeota archaeon]